MRPSPCRLLLSSVLFLILSLTYCGTSESMNGEQRIPSSSIDERIQCPANGFRDCVPVQECNPVKSRERNASMLQVLKTPRGVGAVTIQWERLWGDMLSSISAFVDWIGDSTVRCWMVLLTCIVGDIVATSLMKVASDNNNVAFLVRSILLYISSLLMFGLCLKKIDVSVAYAAWSALGTATTSILGIVLWGEDHDPKKIVCLTLIIVGVMGLQLLDGEL